jgi:hypothetical protein
LALLVGVLLADLGDGFVLLGHDPLRLGLEVTPGLFELVESDMRSPSWR